MVLKGFQSFVKETCVFDKHSEGGAKTLKTHEISAINPCYFSIFMIYTLFY